MGVAFLRTEAEKELRMDCFLAGDIGGSKAILALYAAGAQGGKLIREQRFAVGDYADFPQLLSAFLDGGREKPRVAAFGAAGPVLQGRTRLTSLGWLVDKADLTRKFGFAEVVLVNDLVALATALPVLGPEDLRVINQGTPDRNGAMAVLAPGTGLGEAFCCRISDGYAALPSEGGHSDFAPLTPREERLLAFLRAKSGHVSYERVCSGPGIANIHRFLREAEGMEDSASLREELACAADPTPLIVAQALRDDDGAAREAVAMFFSILAAEAGNAALKFMATGGLYLAGGLFVRLLPLFGEDAFMARFAAKGRMNGLLAGMPIRIVTTERAVLMGAVLLAQQAIRNRSH